MRFGSLRHGARRNEGRYGKDFSGVQGGLVSCDIRRSALRMTVSANNFKGSTGAVLFGSRELILGGRIFRRRFLLFALVWRRRIRKTFVTHFKKVIIILS